MALFKKKGLPKGKREKEGELPELPKLPDLPSLPKGNEEQAMAAQSFPTVSAGLNPPTPEIPSIAASRPPELIPPEFPEIAKPKEKKTLEIATHKAKPELQPSIAKHHDPTPEPPASIPSIHDTKRLPKGNDPIYVRIDKFRNAYNNFQEIYTKISEIEELFKEIKETKQREEEELTEWEKEIEALKMRIDAINQNIFSKIK